MEIFIDCLPCVLRQVLEASRMATDNPEIQRKIMEESIKVLENYKFYTCSPDMVRNMHHIVKRLTGVNDPYKRIKERDILAAKRVEPTLFHYLAEKQDPLYWALKVAATGNIIDSALYSYVDIDSSLQRELSREFAHCDLQDFEDRLKTAKSILIIGDNAGETVFDRVLIKHLGNYDFLYAVRGEPIINDATLQDAYDSGLNDCATLLPTGCKAPGAILDQCDSEFLTVFEKADLVISKGQGNYEALSGCHRPVFFLLKAKCSMIAERLKVHVNDYVFKFHRGETV